MKSFKLVCGQNDEEKKISRKIDKHISTWNKEYKKATQILLLGAGESGKTTIIKQMKILNKDGFSDEEKLERVPFIYKNIQDAIFTLASQMGVLGIHLENEENKPSLDYITALNLTEVITSQSKEFWECASRLWADGGIQEVHTMQEHFHLIDCAKYFLDRLNAIKEPDYLPSVQDVLHCRTRTVGIQKIEFEVKVPIKDGGGSALFWMFDVGGQRGEREKWIQVFDGINAILFLVSSSCFDSVIMEDNTTNRLRESIDIFKKVWDSRFLRQAGYILFLNKQDILKEKIVCLKKSIEPYFPEYSNYCLCSKDMNDEEDSEFLKVKCFIRDKFLDITRISQRNRNRHHSIAPGLSIELEESRRECYPHFIVATDTKNVDHVFKDVYNMILNSALKTYGVI